MCLCVLCVCVCDPVFLPSCSDTKYTVWLPSATGPDELLLHTRGHTEDPAKVREESEAAYVCAELLPAVRQGDTAATGSVTTEQG